MPFAALMLVIAAAALHTGWNLIVKQAGEKQVFTWLALVAGSLIYLPLLAPVPSSIWLYASVSALVEAVYFMTLVRAYEQSDFSLVYPIARGAAPALLAIWAVLFLGERLQPAGVAGLMLLLLGLVIVAGGGWWLRRAVTKLNLRGVGLALGVALCISVYSAIDGAAVRLTSPTSYNVLIFALTALFIAPFVLARYGYRAVVIEWRAQWRRILLVGFLMLLTYQLVLQAYAMARASYVGALRELSIVFAALIGWKQLGEEMGAARTLGAVLIFFGVLVVTVAG